MNPKEIYSKHWAKKCNKISGTNSVKPEDLDKLSTDYQHIIDAMEEFKRSQFISDIQLPCAHMFEQHEQYWGSCKICGQILPNYFDV